MLTVRVAVLDAAELEVALEELVELDESDATLAEGVGDPDAVALAVAEGAADCEAEEVALPDSDAEAVAVAEAVAESVSTLVEELLEDRENEALDEPDEDVSAVWDEEKLLDGVGEAEPVNVDNEVSVLLEDCEDVGVDDTVLALLAELVRDDERVAVSDDEALAVAVVVAVALDVPDCDAEADDDIEDDRDAPAVVEVDALCVTVAEPESVEEIV